MVIDVLLFVYLTYIFFYLFDCLFICLFVWLFIYLFVYLFGCLFIYLFICLVVYVLFIYLFVCLFIQFKWPDLGPKDMLFLECPTEKGLFRHVAHVARLCDQTSANFLTRKHVIIICSSQNNPSLGPISVDFIPNW